MLKKLIALASITALSGVVAAAGCSSSSNGGDGTADSGAKDSGTDTGKRDSAPPVDDQDAEPSTCPLPFPGVTEVKAAAAPKQVCTSIEKFIDDYIKANAQATFKDLEAAIKASAPTGGAACSACVFTKDADASWGPIVFVGDQGGAFFNYGHCFATATGGTAACGKSIQQFEFCADEVCSPDPEGCGSQTAADNCVRKISNDKNSCGQIPIATDCGQALTPLSNLCKTALNVISNACEAVKGAPVDAGDGGN